MKTLLPHQIEDARFLASKKFAGCFSGMGSGKTLTALEAVNILRRQIDPSLPLDAVVGTIIIAPPIALSMWQEEFEEHTGQPAQIVRTGKEPLLYVAAHIMSYEIATKRADALKRLGARVLICDESHALKSTKAKRTKAIIGRGGVCSYVDHSWLLTGTPVTRWNDDIFSFMCRADAFLLSEKIGGLDEDKFRLRFCSTQTKTFSKHQRVPTVVTVGNRNTDELNEMLFAGGMAVRRELADVWAAMPPLTINRLQVRLDADAELKQLLRDLDKQSMAEVQRAVTLKDEHLATIRRKLGVAKVKHAAAEIVDRIKAGVRPLLIGAWHTEVIDAIHDALFAAGIVQIGVIDGRTGPKPRDAFVKGFNHGTLDVIIGQIAAMGVSLNLQGGSHIICVEEDWSPAIMDQFFARCHRIGQADHVHVDIFESDTKLDKAVRRITTAKRRGQATIMEQEEA